MCTILQIGDSYFWYFSNINEISETSSLIYREKKIQNIRVQNVNNMLKSLCEKNSFYFIENSNIRKTPLYEDGVHLLESGKIY